MRSLDVGKPLAIGVVRGDCDRAAGAGAGGIRGFLTAMLDKTLLRVVDGADAAIDCGIARGVAEWRVSSAGEEEFLPPMSLGAAGTGIAETDVAVGPSENSLVAVVITKDGTLATVTFDNRGQRVAGPAAIVPRTPQHDLADRAEYFSRCFWC